MKTLTIFATALLCAMPCAAQSVLDSIAQGPQPTTRILSVNERAAQAAALAQQRAQTELIRAEVARMKAEAEGIRLQNESAPVSVDTPQPFKSPADAKMFCAVFNSKMQQNNALIMQALAESRLDPLGFVVGILRLGSDDGLRVAAYEFFRPAFIPGLPEKYPGREWLTRYADLMDIGGLLLNNSGVKSYDEVARYLEELKVTRNGARISAPAGPVQ